MRTEMAFAVGMAFGVVATLLSVELLMFWSNK